MSNQTLRIIDANLNRAGEGLRLLEDIARLILNDEALTQQLKDLRHRLIRSELSFQQQLLQARDADDDIGSKMEVSGETKQQDLPLVAVANARRVQEALRVLEEIAKIPPTVLALDSEKFREARFSLYNLERELLGKLQRQDKIKLVSGLYAIMDTLALKGRSHLQAAQQAIRGGAKIIQLRDKSTVKSKLCNIACKLKELCTRNGVLFIVNDYLDITLASDADGLHIGQEDLPVAIARRELPIDKILGVSTETAALAVKAQSDGADYVAVGAVFPTSSKEKVDAVGLARISEVSQAVSVPVVAIGGINRDNAKEVIAAGASAVAVISAILQGDNIEEASRQIVSQLSAKSERTKQ